MYIPNGILSILESSTLAYCNRIAQAMNTQLGLDFEVVLFDAYAENEPLPEKDLIGVYRLEFELDSHFIKGSFLLGVATLNDPQLFRLRKASSFVLDQVKPEMKINLVTENGDPVLGNLIIMDGVAVLPVEGNTRPAKFFGIHFNSTATV